MKKNLTLSIVFIILFGITKAYSSLQDTISIENVNVIPMTEEKVLIDQRVMISKGKILKIESSTQPLLYKVDLTIDGSNKYLIPGLAEMHYHFRSNDIESDLKLLIANGITTVRNMAEFDGQDHIDIKKNISNGELLGPNYYTTGPYLTSKDFQTIKDIEYVVSYHKERGYDFLKLADNIPLPLYLRLLEECEKISLPIIGHSQRDIPLEYSLRMSSIEHIEEFIYLSENKAKKSIFQYNEDELTQLAVELRESGIYIGTTLTIFDFINNCLNDKKFAAFQEDDLRKYLAADQREAFLTEKNDYRKLKDKEFDGVKAPILFQEYFIWMKKFAKILFDNHVPMLIGSDTYGMVIVGFSLSKEFELLEDAGVRPYEILLASTVKPARYLGVYGTQGTISVGKNADLILLTQNPLENIKNIRSIEGVFVKGEWVDINKISLMLKEVEETYKE